MLGVLTDGLNPRQREAVEYRGRALCIVAGAGSGKTRVLTTRIASLIETRDAWPSQVLAITFTNKAAAEMRERVGKALGTDTSGMWVSTFHSACVRILRREAESLGFPSAFTIYDSAEQRTLLKSIVKELAADTLGITPAAAQRAISKLKNDLIDVDDYARTVAEANPRDRVILEIYRRYSERLRRVGAFDFDDLISETVYLLRAFPRVAALYQRRFRHVFVDEYQDTNRAQYALIRELTRPVAVDVVADLDAQGVLVAGLADASGSIPGASLTVVGDADQSIYAFRGADMRNILEFERDFPDAKIVLLEQNYRSTQNILSAANAVISNNFDRPEKSLWTDIGDGEKIVGYTGYSAYDEAQFVADEIARLRGDGLAYRDMAVFYRTNAQTRALEEIFVRAAVPYRIIGGTRFFERAEIKDALAYLTAVVNPLDELALRRIINTPRRGIGDTTIAAIAAHAAATDIPFRQAMRETPGVHGKAATSLVALCDVLDRGEGLVASAPVADILTMLVAESGLVTKLRATGDTQDETRAENVEELVSQARDFDREHPDGTPLDYLTQVALVADTDDLDDVSGTVSLMTLHTAKGLEFRAVFLTGVEDGIMPHQMSVNEPGGPAEERRLFYVGITRARERLFLSLAMSRTVFGSPQPSAPSRFLLEIPEGLVRWCDEGAGRLGGRGYGADHGLRAGTGRGAWAADDTGGGFGMSERGRLVVGRGADARGGGAPWRGARASNSGSESSGWRDRSPASTAWTQRVTATVRDNGDLTLEPGDRLLHDDFGEGLVTAVIGEGGKRVAHVAFDTAGPKKLLVRIAPITKL